MSNTTAKLNSYIALGYSITAANAPVKEDAVSEVEKETAEDKTVLNSAEVERVAQINNEVVRTIDFQVKPGGLRV